MDPKDDKTSFFRLEKDSDTSSGNASDPPAQQSNPNLSQQYQQQRYRQQQYQQQQYQQQQRYQQQQQYQQQQYQQQQRYQQQQYQQQQRYQQQQQIPQTHHSSTKRELSSEELETRKRMALIFKSVVISFGIFGLLIAVTIFSTTYLKDFKFPRSTSDNEVVQNKPKKRTKKRDKKESTKEYSDVYEMDNPKITGVRRSLLPDNVRVTINDNVRSGKIDTKEQLKYLRDSHHINRIINLALDSTFKQSCPERDKKSSVMCEKIWAKQLGLDYIYIPLTNKGPSDENWEIIKEYLLEGNTLVHCTHGADRTGAVIGRLYFEETNVDREEILEKSLKYGFKAETYAYPGGKPDPNKHLREWMFDEYE